MFPGAVYYFIIIVVFWMHLTFSTREKTKSQVSVAVLEGSC